PYTTLFRSGSLDGKISAPRRIDHRRHQAGGEAVPGHRQTARRRAGAHSAGTIRQRGGAGENRRLTKLIANDGGATGGRPSEHGSNPCHRNFTLPVRNAAIAT